MLSVSSHSCSVLCEGKTGEALLLSMQLLTHPRAVGFSSSTRIFVPQVLQSVHKMFTLFSSVQVTQTVHNNAYKASLVLVQIISQPHQKKGSAKINTD